MDSIISDILITICYWLPILNIMLLRSLNHNYNNIISSNDFGKIIIRLQNNNICKMEHLDHIPNLYFDINITNETPLFYNKIIRLHLQDHSYDIDFVNRCSNLKYLWLANNNITDSHIKNLNNISELGIYRNEKITNNGISHMEKLTSLNLSYNTKIDNLNSTHTNITTLILIRSVLSNESLCQFTNVTNLDIQYNTHINDFTLCKLTNIKKLCLAENAEISDLSIQKLTNITSLWLDNNTNITIDKLTDITYLKIRKIHNINDLQLRNLTKINTLSLNNCNAITMKSIKFLTNITSLTILNSKIDGTNLSLLTNIITFNTHRNPNIRHHHITNMLQLKNLCCNDFITSDIQRMPNLKTINYIEI